MRQADEACSYRARARQSPRCSALAHPCQRIDTSCCGAALSLSKASKQGAEERRSSLARHHSTAQDTRARAHTTHTHARTSSLRTCTSRRAGPCLSPLTCRCCQALGCRRCPRAPAPQASWLLGRRCRRRHRRPCRQCAPPRCPLALPRPPQPPRPLRWRADQRARRCCCRHCRRPARCCGPPALPAHPRCRPCHPLRRRGDWVEKRAPLLPLRCCCCCCCCC